MMRSKRFISKESCDKEREKVCWMRRSFIFLFTFIILFCGGLIMFIQSDYFEMNIARVDENVRDVPHVQSEQTKKQATTILSGSLFDYVNKTVETLTQEFGEPERKDQTPYGYTWWVYTDHE